MREQHFRRARASEASGSRGRLDMDEGLRRLLRRLALGLPIGAAGIAIASAPALLACSCPAPQPVSEILSASWSEGGEGEAGEGESTMLSCATICERAHRETPHSCSLVGEREASCEYVRIIGESCGAGRLPVHAPIRHASAGRSPITRWLLATATLEVAAVPAFRELAGALRGHAAPPSLVERASRAAHDEVRHARLLITIAARREGHAAVRVVARRAQHASLEALAIHNATAGCVGEAHAALVAASQADAASDPDVRWAMARIARDEAQHALLSLDVHAWAQARLGARARGRVERVRREAARVLAAESERAFDAEPESLGLPCGAHARALAAMVG